MSFNEFFESQIREKKLSIQRFSGTNQMSDTNFLKFLYNLQSIASDGNINLKISDNITMTEKFDASPANWGFDGEFFIESTNSGEVKSEEIEKLNNQYTKHFYESFKFLENYEQFINRLNKAYEYAGQPVKFISEMFPVLTHLGDEFGDFVFASTKYNKNKLGQKGAFMVFDVKVKEGNIWKSPSKDIKNILIDIIRAPDDSEWKIFSIDYDGKLSGTLQFEFSGIKDWISDQEKLQNSINLLKNNNSKEKEILKDLIEKIRPSLQMQLDSFAEKSSSSLGNNNSPIEGVVLKVSLPTGNYFIKGTSQIFKNMEKGTWGTRKDLGVLEKTLTGQFLKDVIGLKTSQPALLNKTIDEVKKSFTSDLVGEELINSFVLEVKKALTNNDVIIDEESARIKAKEYIDAANKQLNDVIINWQNIKNTVDIDSVNKTEAQLKYTRKILDNLEKIIVDKQYYGDAYLVYLLRILLGHRLDNVTDLKELNIFGRDWFVKNKNKNNRVNLSDTIDDLDDFNNNVVHPQRSAYDDLDDNLEVQPDSDQKLKDKALHYAKTGLGGEPETWEESAEAVDDLDDINSNIVHPQRSAYDDLDDNLEVQPDSDQKLKDKALHYAKTGLGGEPETWEESAEEFDESELLDERKFERIKMARNLLSKMGYPQSYSRNDKNKYVLRAKDIRKLMKKLKYEFSDAKGRWIIVKKSNDKKLNPDELLTRNNVLTPNTKDVSVDVVNKSKKAIIWVGRAQPWHKGHDVLVQTALSKMSEIGANMVFIMIVKGEISSEDKNRNPLGFEQQINLISHIYENEQSIDISSIAVPSASIVDIFATASKQDIVIKGWIAGSDRIDKFKKQYDSFKTGKYKQEFEQKTSPNTPYPVDGDIHMLDVGRSEEPPSIISNVRDEKEKQLLIKKKLEKNMSIADTAKSTMEPTISVDQMSGTLARWLISKLDFDHWFKEVCPQKYIMNRSTKIGYNEVYFVLGGQIKEEFNEPVKYLKETLSSIFFEGQNEDRAKSLLTKANKQDLYEPLLSITSEFKTNQNAKNNKHLPVLATWVVTGQVTPEVIKQYYRRFINNPKISAKPIDSLTFSQFEQLVDSSVETKDEKITDLSQEKPVYEDENIKIYHGSDKNQCVRFGQGKKYGFCISRSDASNLYHGYRKQGATFFFVYFKNEKSKNGNAPSDLIVIHSYPDNQYQVNYAIPNRDHDISEKDLIKKFPALASPMKSGVFSHKEHSETEKLIYDKIEKAKSILELKNVNEQLLWVEIGKKIKDKEWEKLLNQEEIAKKYTEVGSHDLPNQVLTKFPKLQNRYIEKLKQRIDAKVGSEDNPLDINFTPHEMKIAKNYDFKFPENFDENDKLQFYAKLGNLEKVRSLVENGADIHARNDDALQWASENGHLETVKFLVENGANIQAQDDYALRWASSNGHLEIVKFLIENGADVHAQNDSALQWASDNGHLDVFNYLKSVMGSEKSVVESTKETLNSIFFG